MANVEHSTLTGSDLHEPKGIAAAAANRVYLSDGAASGSWTTVPAAAITAAGVLVFQSQYYNVRDERSSGTDGDNLTSSTWNTRTLNTEVTDDLTITTSGNQITLAAGTYYVEAGAVANFTGTANPVTNPTFLSKLRLRNATDSTTLVNGIGIRWYHTDQSGADAEAVDAQINAHLAGRFTLAGTKAVELQNWVKNNLAAVTSTKGGKAISSGENEVYAEVRLWKLS